MKHSKETLQREREVLNAIYDMLKELEETPVKDSLSKIENIQVNIGARVIEVEKQLGIRKR